MPPSFRGEDFFLFQPIRNKNCPIGMKGGNLIEDLLWMLSTKIRFTWSSGFRENILEIDQSEMTMAAMFVNGLGPNEQSL